MRTFVAAGVQLLPDTLGTPSLVDGIAKGAGNTILSVGGMNVGLPWHSHGATWLAGIVGRKRWFLYPPGEARGPLRGHPLRSAAGWATQTLPRLRPDERPLTCIQQPGEVVYLPSIWAHATVNIDDVVAIGTQHSMGMKVELPQLQAGCKPPPVRGRRSKRKLADPDTVDPEFCVLLSHLQVVAPKIDRCITRTDRDTA
jgi:hypothetical protein